MRASSVIVHLLAMAGASCVRGVLYTSLNFVLGLFPPALPFFPYLWRAIVGWLPVAAVVYGGILAGGAAVEFARRLSEREVAAARLGEELARAELASIRARLHPHFLFNALHAIGALARGGERDRTVEMVTALSDLLREVLQRDARDLVRFDEELSFVRRYLAIESVRFSDRLRVAWDIEPGVQRALVAPLLVQALVENAVRHGIERSSRAGCIAVRVRRVRDQLEITVTDDGPGPEPGPAGAERRGFGLDAARVRLRLLHGNGAELTLLPGAAGGTVASVRLPWQEQRPDGAAFASAGGEAHGFA